MIWKWIGACCVMTACGSFGFLLAFQHLGEVKVLRQFLRTLNDMECELEYHLTTIPMLCRGAAAQSKGVLSRVFLNLAVELENQILPDVERCMYAAISRSEPVPSLAKEMLIRLGKQLGRFDLQGQLKGLEEVRQMAQAKLDDLNHNKDVRIRGYKTLGLCAGAALVILFI